jgi:hypothetical protein
MTDGMTQRRSCPGNPVSASAAPWTTSCPCATKACGYACVTLVFRVAVVEETSISGHESISEMTHTLTVA